MNKLLLFAFLLFAFTPVSAQDNNSLNFNGAANADCGTGAGFNITGTTITVEAWIYPTAFTTNFYEGSIIAKDQPLTKGYVLRCGGTGQLSFTIGVTGNAWVDAVSGNNELTLNQWQHVAGVYNGSAVLLYVNGVQVQSVSETRSLAEDNAIPLMIGGSPGGWSRYFTGRIDEVRVWNVARTVSQLRSNLFKPVSTGTGLVASYRMTDGSGTSLTDNSGNGNTATLSAGVSWQTSPIRFSANALSFDGTDDIVTIPRQPAHDISAAITLEGWIYATKNSGVQNVMAKTSGGNLSGYIFPRTDDGWTNTTCWFYIGGAWRAFAAPYPGLNAWHHLAATYDGSNVKIYVDGILKTTTAQTGAITTSSIVNITLGNQAVMSEYFGGAADELRVWNVARSQAAIQADMNREIDPATATGLVAYFTNNQGIPSGTNSGLNFIQDLAGTQHGTLSNFSLSGTSSNFVEQNNALTVLPLKWLSFSARKSGDDVLLQWSTAEELRVKNFAIQHSKDGINWATTGTINSSTHQQYSFTHTHPGKGTHYYRLQQFDLDGASSYSAICRVDLEELTGSLAVYPNPVIGGVLQVYMPAAGMLRLYDAGGNCIRFLPANEGWQQLNTTGIAAGIYYLQTGKKGSGAKVVIR